MSGDQTLEVRPEHAWRWSSQIDESVMTNTATAFLKTFRTAVRRYPQVTPKIRAGAVLSARLCCPSSVRQSGRTRGRFSDRINAMAVCLIGGVMIGQLAAGNQRPPLTYFVAEGDPAAGYRAADRDLAAWAFAAWDRNGGGTLRLEPSPERAAVVRLYWVSPNGTTYGEMRPLLVNGRRGAEVFVRPDIGALGADIASRGSQDPLWRDTIVYLTCLHELGHAFGLPHTADNRDIMYSFQYGGDIVEYFARYRRQLAARSDIASHSGLSEADVRQLRLLRRNPEQE